MDPKIFYTLKNSHLNRAARLLDEVGGILSNLHDLEAQAPAGDPTEVMSLCVHFDDLRRELELTQESIQPFLEER